MPAAARLSVVREPAMGDEAEQHEGSRWDLRIREGLVEPKHRRAMGEAVWLYLYLHAHAGFETGVMPRYRHDVASEALDIPLRTIKRYMERLEDAGYVVVTQSRYACRVEITRYTVAERTPPPPPDVPKVAPVKPSRSATNGTPSTDETVQECQNEHPGVPNPARGTNTSVFNNKVRTTAKAVVAPRPAQKQPRQPKVRAPKPAYPVWLEPVYDAMAPPLGWSAVKEDTRKKWAPILAPLEAVSEDNRLRFVSWLFSTGYYKGKGYMLGTRLAGELAAWLADDDRPASKPVWRSNGQRPRGEPMTPEARETARLRGVVKSCFCGATLDIGHRHHVGCGCTGLATEENSYQPYRDGPREGIYTP